VIDMRSIEVTPRLSALFDSAAPAALRCFAVLDGTAAGQILTDDPIGPTWAAVRDAGSSTLYLGGLLDAERVRDVVARLRQSGDVLVGTWPDDERLALLPPDPEYDGWTLDFVDRAGDDDFETLPRHLPRGCELRPMDRELLEQCADRDYYASIFGGPEQALRRGFGCCLVRDGEVVCEAFAGPAALGLIELSVATREADRGRGYATITCARLIRDCAAAGLRPYWNCARQNIASTGLARKLGFREGKEYRLLAWFKQAERA
jgi:RimJ/RimL family protein N-acetyltransferase